MRRLARALVRALCAVLAGLTLLILLLAGGCQLYATIAGLGYARDFWDGKVAVEAVLASKRWHDPIGDPFMGIACTYAVVTFDATTADRIQAEGPGSVLDLDWRPTPAPGPGDRDENYVSSFECASETRGLGPRIEAALAEPGSWYILEHESAFLLAPSARLAAKFRYGD